MSEGPSSAALTWAGMSSGPSMRCVQNGARSGTAASNQLSKSRLTSGEAFSLSASDAEVCWIRRWSRPARRRASSGSASTTSRVMRWKPRGRGARSRRRWIHTEPTLAEGGPAGGGEPRCPAPHCPHATALRQRHGPRPRGPRPPRRDRMNTRTPINATMMTMPAVPPPSPCPNPPKASTDSPAGGCAAASQRASAFTGGSLPKRSAGAERLSDPRGAHPAATKLSVWPTQTPRLASSCSTRSPSPPTTSRSRSRS